MSAYETIIVERPEPRIARIVMNRPEARNAQNLQMTYDLNAAFDSAVQDDAVDPVVANAIESAAPTDEVLRRVEAAPGRSAEIAVVLYLSAGLRQVEVDAIVERVQTALAASDIVAARVDSVELRLAEF